MEFMDSAPRLSGPCPQFLSLNVTVDLVQVHRSSALNLTSERVELLSAPTTMDLIRQTHTPGILAAASVSEGDITMIRMHVVPDATALIDENGNDRIVSVMVSSDEIKIPVSYFKVSVRGQLSTRVFLGLEAHVVCEGNGQFRLTPVVGVNGVEGPTRELSVQF